MNNHFSTMDSNDDGMVSREEHLDNAAKRFDAADANGDGMLSKEEIKKSFIKQRKEKTKKLEEAS
jgi:Ca2+-binding EF-hand superfamily protein